MVFVAMRERERESRNLTVLVPNFQQYCGREQAVAIVVTESKQRSLSLQRVYSQACFPYAKTLNFNLPYWTVPTSCKECNICHLEYIPPNDRFGFCVPLRYRCRAPTGSQFCSNVWFQGCRGRPPLPVGREQFEGGTSRSSSRP